MEAGNFAAITALTAQIIGWIREARGKGNFLGVEHPGLYPYGGASAKDIAEWYGRVFGFKVTEGSSSFFVEGSGFGRIEIMKQGETDRCHIAVEVADFEAALAALKAQGIELQEPIIRPHLKAVYLKQPDPAGNLVHLLWRR